MCRKQPDGTYRYCPSKQSRTVATRGQDVYDLGHDLDGAKRLRHRKPLTAATALDGIVRAAHTGAALSPETLTEMRQFAATPIPPSEKWRLWTDITAGTSISGALTAMSHSGFLAQFPELAALDGVPQDPHWHPEGDALTHVGLAGDHMARQCEQANITGDDRHLLVLAATLHDLGKATHTHIHDDGKITSYGHDDAGVAPMHRLLVAMDAPPRFGREIEPIIREHMCAATVQKTPSANVVRRLRKRLAPATMEQWVRVVNADHAGRGPASVEDYARQWLDVAQQIDAESPPRAHLVAGQHLIDAGLRPGPQFRDILKAARQAELDGTIVDAASAANWVRNQAGSASDTWSAPIRSDC